MMAAICEAAGCSSSVKGRGLCEKHLVRLRRTGALELQPAPRPDCPVCSGPVPPSNFGRIYCSPQCKKKSNGQRHYARHGDKVRQRAREFLASDRGQDLTLRRRYGISLERREALLREQGGKCVFCDSAGPLFVDHDHHTGQVRGLLCRSCNVLLGRIGDGDPEVVNQYLRYMGLQPTKKRGQ